MNYNILKVHAEYGNGQLLKVSVLVEISEGDIRAITATTKPVSGYFYLMPGTPLNESLLQRVAAQGREVMEWEGGL